MTKTSEPKPLPMNARNLSIYFAVFASAIGFIGFSLWIFYDILDALFGRH